MNSTTPIFSVGNKKFNVVILASGVGTRLKPETDFIPKALIELGDSRAIDFLISKYQYLADRTIITVGYSADLLRNYLKGRYPAVNLKFSYENVSELKGPGNSLLYALDYCDSRLPSLITFCDYIIDDQFSVERDAICICKPLEGHVYGTYKSLGILEEGVVIDIIKNNNLEVKENGFTGVSVIQNTTLLKSIVYNSAIEKSNSKIDYTFDIIAKYVKEVRTLGLPISKLLEFGDEETLKETRAKINGNF